MAKLTYQNAFDGVANTILSLIHSYSAVTPDVKYTIDSKLVDDCGFDSLDTIEVVMMVEDEFNIEISDEMCDGISTVADLVELVMNQICPQEAWYTHAEPSPTAPGSDPTPPEPRYISVGVTSAIPGTDGGFTMVCFVGRDVPVGTEVFMQAHE